MISLYRIIKNNVFTSMVMAIILVIEIIFLYEIVVESNKEFSFTIDPSIKGSKRLWDAFNVPIYIFLSSIAVIRLMMAIDDKLNKNNPKENLTKGQKHLIKQIHNKEITDFETLIIKYLKPEILPLGTLCIIGNTEFKPDDKVYIFIDPRETTLKIRSMLEVLNFLLENKAIELISKYERIDRSKILNPFYVFTKPPSEKEYHWDNRLNNIIYENFGITYFDKEIKPIENRLKQYF